MAWSGRQTIINLGSPENQERLTSHIPGAEGQSHERLQASHFIQEDIGEILADRVIKFIQANPIEGRTP